MFPRRILVPVDFSTHSEVVIEKAVQLAQPLGSELTLLHVHEPIVTGPAFGDVMPIPPATSTQEFDSRLVELARDYRSRGLTVDTRCLVGAAAAEILALAQEEAFDLVVMGTHGHTGWRHLLLGSVAERVVRESSCPVLVVPMRAGAGAG